MKVTCLECGAKYPPISHLDELNRRCPRCVQRVKNIVGHLDNAAAIGEADTVIDDRHTFSSGAMSSGRKPRYDLIPTYALIRIARRFEMGAAKYGEWNWQKGVGDRAFILDRINHSIEHLLNLRDRLIGPTIPPETVDDDAAGVILNAIFVMGYQEGQKNMRTAQQGKTDAGS